MHNLSEHTITITAGTRVGKYKIASVEQMQLTKDGVQLSSSLQRSKSFKPITQKEKKAEYLRHLVDSTKRASPCLKGKEQLEAAVNLLLRH